MNVKEILNIAKERKVKLKVSIEKLVECAHKKIKYYATLKKESCTYMVPPIINDTPLYDITYVVKEIFKVLDSEGYIVTAYPNGRLDICWNEKLVQEKINTDSYVVSLEEKKLRNITKKKKNVDQKFSFLANPAKIKISDPLDDQVKKILGDKDSQQNKYKKMVGNFNKI
jgi:hypothetical protein